MVGHDLRRQGWKLHISCTPDRATALLERVALLLDAHGTPFKFARSLLILENIQAGQFGHTQVGKFLTVYPRAHELSALAEELVAITREFYGPAVSTDFHLGGTVYARHGAIHPLLERDRLGSLRKLVDGPDGECREDTYAVPPVLADDADWPFTFLPRPTGKPFRMQTGVVEHLVAMGLRPVLLMKQRSKGAIVQATSLDGRERFVIKQGRRWHLSDRWGRDVVWRLLREFETHQRLEDGQGILRALRFERIGGDGFLVFPYLQAQNLEEIVTARLHGRPLAQMADGECAALRQVAAGLVRAVAYLHGQGMVHRDLAPANVLVSKDLGVHLIDLEMTTPIGSLEPAVGIGTKGFVSPQQTRAEPPSVGDDVYAVGALLQLLFTGIDPRRLEPMPAAQRLEAVSRLAGGDLRHDALLRMVCAATELDPDHRPTLKQLLEVLCEEGARIPGRDAGSVRNAALGNCATVRARRLAADGLRGLQSICAGSPMTWPRSLPLGADESECEDRDLERLLGVNRGLAGLVYVEAHLAGAVGTWPSSTADRVRLLTQAVQNLDDFADGAMPGLHFGTAGIAVALHGAVLASGQQAPDDLLMLLLSRPFDWPDLMHGAAGQGLAALMCGPRFHHLAERAAVHLQQTQTADGTWPCPASIPALAGSSFSGFAHGAAGILYFLATHVLVTGNPAARPAIDRGVGALLRDAFPDDRGGLAWRRSSRQAEPMHWWCHGGPGIALTLARLFELSGDDDYMHLAERALAFHAGSSRHGNLGQCHGLSGLGEIYLEMAYTTGEQTWARRALDLVDTIEALALHVSSGARVWRTENTSLATADFGVGSAGVVHFLARLGHPDAGLPPPFLLRIPKRHGQACVL